jgi:hypothetical protein
MSIHGKDVTAKAQRKKRGRRGKEIEKTLRPFLSLCAFAVTSFGEART